MYVYMYTYASTECLIVKRTCVLVYMYTYIYIDVHESMCIYVGVCMYVYTYTYASTQNVILLKALA